jgi:hypothetical protein
MAFVSALKSIAKAILPKTAVKHLRRIIHREVWPPAFDNTYPWLNYTFSELLKDERCEPKPMYAWGVMQGAALAKVLRLPRISIIEFGVAGGHGLLALETISDLVERKTNIGIDVFGFDTGIGLPKPEDFRDHPNLYSQNQFPMDRARLESKLRHAKLCLGPVKETIPLWIAGKPAPVAFVSFDLDLYSSTRDALTVFKSDYAHLLPRVVSYFDDIFGYTFNDQCGERAAIAEFNSCSSDRKICPIYGLRYVIPRFARDDSWPDGMYLAHFFEHPFYSAQDSLSKPLVMALDGKAIWGPSKTNEAPSHRQRQSETLHDHLQNPLKSKRSPTSQKAKRTSGS